MEHEVELMMVDNERAGLPGLRAGHSDPAVENASEAPHDEDEPADDLHQDEPSGIDMEGVHVPAALAGEAQAQADENTDRLSVEEARKVEVARQRKERAARRAKEQERRRIAAGVAKKAQVAPVETKVSRVADAKALFKTRCAACHGTSGHGDGPAAPGLDPKPRNFADPAWKAQTPRSKVRTAILKGGPAIGLSPLMPAFPALAQDEDLLRALVDYVRSM